MYVSFHCTEKEAETYPYQLTHDMKPTVNSCKYTKLCTELQPHIHTGIQWAYFNPHNMFSALSMVTWKKLTSYLFSLFRSTTNSDSAGVSVITTIAMPMDLYCLRLLCLRFLLKYRLTPIKSSIEWNRITFSFLHVTGATVSEW